MKYITSNEVIPQEARKELNEKVLYLINNNLCEQVGISQQDIYSAYTGKGQLHDLKFKDYNSYYDFSNAKKEIEQGEFFSPDHVCKFITDILKPDRTELICDFTAGVGRFCNHAVTESNFYLNDIDINNYKIMKYLYPDAKISSEDMVYYKPNITFDYIVGNPPYGLKINTSKGEYLSQFYYCMKSYDLLKPLGFLCFIVPNSFMDDDFINKYQVEYMNKHFNYICQFDLPIDSFKQVGINHIETKVMIFQKKSKLVEQYKEFDFKKLTVTELTEQNSEYIFNQYIQPLKDQQMKLKSKLFFESLHSNSSTKKSDVEFNFKMQKLFFDIKRNPKINKYYSDAIEYYNQYLNQKKPENLNWQQWEEQKITKKKVIKYCKNILKKQHRTEQEKICIVKNNYGLSLKGYSDRTESYVNSMNNKYISFNDMIINNNYPFEDKKYYKLFQKKLNAHENQSQSFDDMQEDQFIKSWLNSNHLYDHENEEKIYLNNKQKYDINLALQKQYSYLAWETGSGKSLSSLMYGLYRLQYSNIKNVFVVAPAIAVKNTYVPMLENFKIPYIVIQNIKDIENIRDGQFILMTFNILSKNCVTTKYNKKDIKEVRLYKFIKKFINQHGTNKFCLILDEADQISNITSLRTNAVLTTFRKLKYKLLCSATSIRNNLSEFKTALDLLYNNSINMLSTTEYIYITDKETGELKEECNTYYNKPIPPYREGFNLYTAMFNPHKTTVLGISKYNQDIYSKDKLKKIINKTLLIRTLKDITGRDLYNINQIPCTFNSAEKDLYTKVLEEFHSMMEYHIITGNSRKDAMFKILAQLNTLLKCCSIPQDFKEYLGGTPSKFKQVFKLLNTYNDEIVAIGCTRIKTVNLYANELRMRYPDRPLFVIVGNETTFKQRREIISQLKESKNGILLSTMQSLSCSVSIPFVDKVITVENLWNDASCQQYRARFTRYNSDNVTDIYNLIYKDSIEANLMRLILVKENLCLTMKNEYIEEDEELFEKYGIDSYIFNCLMTKEKDSGGNVRITWGEQNIV